MLSFESSPPASLVENEETCFVTHRVEECGGGMKYMCTIYHLSGD